MIPPVTLSARQTEAVRLYASGHTRDQVAHRMGLTSWTVKTLLERARAKYEAAGRPAGSKLELRNRAIEDRIIDAHHEAGRPGGSLLGDTAWSPDTSPTARLLRLPFHVPTGLPPRESRTRIHT